MNVTKDKTAKNDMRKNLHEALPYARRIHNIEQFILCFALCTFACLEAVSFRVPNQTNNRTSI